MKTITAVELRVGMVIKDPQRPKVKGVVVETIEVSRRGLRLVVNRAAVYDANGLVTIAT